MCEMKMTSCKFMIFMQSLPAPYNQIIQMRDMGALGTCNQNCKFYKFAQLQVYHEHNNG